MLSFDAAMTQFCNMSRRWLTLGFMTAAACANAAPEYVDVAGVASNDTLNVREAPNASAADIGDLAPFATGIEVLERDGSGKWGRIIWREGNGWIAMRYTRPSPVPFIAETRLPIGLVCTGTEPFWSLTLLGKTGFFADFSDDYTTLSMDASLIAAGYAQFPVALSLSTDTDFMLATLRPLQCSDDMSDRTYGWTVDVFIQSPDGQRLLKGCCRLPFDAGQN